MAVKDAYVAEIKQAADDAEKKARVALESGDKIKAADHFDESASILRKLAAHVHAGAGKEALQRRVQKLNDAARKMRDSAHKPKAGAHVGEELSLDEQNAPTIVPAKRVSGRRTQKLPKPPKLVNAPKPLPARTVAAPKPANEPAANKPVATAAPRPALRLPAKAALRLPGKAQPAPEPAPAPAPEPESDELTLSAPALEPQAEPITTQAATELKVDEPVSSTHDTKPVAPAGETRPSESLKSRRLREPGAVQTHHTKTGPILPFGGDESKLAPPEPDPAPGPRAQPPHDDPALDLEAEIGTVLNQPPVLAQADKPDEPARVDAALDAELEPASPNGDAPHSADAPRATNKSVVINLAEADFPLRSPSPDKFSIELSPSFMTHLCEALASGDLRSIAQKFSKLADNLSRKALTGDKRNELDLRFTTLVCREVAERLLSAPANDPSEALERARDAYRAGDWRGAASHYKQAAVLLLGRDDAKAADEVVLRHEKEASEFLNFSARLRGLANPSRDD